MEEMEGSDEQLRGKGRTIEERKERHAQQRGKERNMEERRGQT